MQVKNLLSYMLYVSILCLLSHSSFGQQCFKNFNLSPTGNQCGTSVTVYISGSEIGVTYQLKLNGNNLGPGISGNGGSMQLGIIYAGNGGMMQVIASKSGCSPTPVASAPIFVATPFVGNVTATNTVFCSNSPVTYTLNTASSSGLSFQWYRDGTQISGAIGLTYSASVSGTYTVKVNGPCGEVTLPCPAISPAGPVPSAPGPVTGPNKVNYGTMTSVYTVTAAANASSYTWSLSDNSAGTISGGTTGTLNWNPSFSGTVVVGVSANGICESTPAQGLLVSRYGKFSAGQISPETQNINYSTLPAVLRCTPSGGSGDYTYQWQHSSDNINFTDISGAIDKGYSPAVLTISTYYRVKVQYGDTTAYTPVASITVGNGPPPTGNSLNYITSSNLRIPGITAINDPSQLKAMPKESVNQTIQYIDGLGRPLQTIQIKGSPTGKDIVQPMAYDLLGRETTKYLPYVSATVDGSYQANALQAGTGQAAFYYPPGSTMSSGKQQANGIVFNPNPFSVTKFEDSPLNRVLEQGAPGSDWQPVAGHTIKQVYTLNNTTQWTGTDTATSTLVAFYKVTTNANQSRTLLRDGNYGAGQLQVTISKDENWRGGRGGTSEEYKDKSGKVVLKRTYNYSGGILQRLSTYYVYDDFGNLSYVLPPGTNPDAVGVPLNTENMAYLYRYDDRNRLTQKKIPGRGWERMVYNQLDQQVLKQDSLQSMVNQWTVTKYDGFGRVTMIGLWNAGSAIPMNALRDSIYAKAQWDIADKNTNVIAYPLGYQIKSYPVLNQVLTVNYYDDYLFPGNPFNSTVVGNLTKPVGLVTASKVAVLNTLTKTSPDMLWSVNYYDSYGRNNQTFKQHYLGGILTAGNYDVVTNTYEDITDLLIQTKREHYKGGTTGALSLTIVNNYTYDHTGRKLNTTENINNTGEQLLAHLDYNEIGQLNAKSLHGIGSAGGTNAPANLTLGAADAVSSGQEKHVTATGSIVLGPGFFAASGSTFSAQISGYMQTIKYAYNERGWFQSGISELFQEELQYNTALNQNGVVPTPQFNGNIATQSWGKLTAPNTKTSRYVYDQLNRLVLGNSTTGNGESSIQYDQMGNIMGLRRYASNTPIDQLKYTYITNTNQLQSVTDSTTNNSGLKSGTSSYAYNGNGSLISDSGKGITNIKYNLLELPESVTATGFNLTYTYDASGQKLRANKGTNTTDYVSGIQYENGSISFIQTEEGRALPNGPTAFNYEYTLKDHLGNSRVNFDTATGTARLVQSDDYYPFGMNIIVGNRPSVKNNYLYNSKELQEELGLFDYGARFYDPVIGRWNVVDPLAELGRKWSPYTYGNNNPIRFIDPNGMYTTDANGNVSSDSATEAIAMFNQLASLFSQNDGPGKKKKEKGQTGSYTITFENNKTYSGKGPLERAKESAKRVADENDIKVKENGIDWAPSENDREAFKDEDTRINNHGGVGSDENYNKIKSPGAKYKEEDKKKAEAERKKSEEPDASRTTKNLTPIDALRVRPFSTSSLPTVSKPNPLVLVAGAIGTVTLALFMLAGG